MPRLTYAFCTYNRANRLEKLVTAMREQACPIPFDILAVNNNSSDNTIEILQRLMQMPGASLRWVTEPVQGIVAARNRCIVESLNQDIMVFIDDDEMPLQGLLEAAVDAILNEGAQCVGGRIELDFSAIRRPRWLEDNLLGFLGALSHGNKAFKILDTSTPIWTGNIAYDMRLFRDNPRLRFDTRYDRKEGEIGGGEDYIMFRTLLESGVYLRYCPKMVILHEVDPCRLKRSYFLERHYRAGLRRGQFDLPDYAKSRLGIPLFLVRQFISHGLRTLRKAFIDQSGGVREAMTFFYTLGLILGYRKRVQMQRA
jgi:glycosyltransferase involved in cell wall biosynthesis